MSDELAWRSRQQSHSNLPVELLCLGCDLKIDILLLCSQCQLAVPVYPRRLPLPVTHRDH